MHQKTNVMKSQKIKLEMIPESKVFPWPSILVLLFLTFCIMHGFLVQIRGKIFVSPILFFPTPAYALLRR